MLLMSAVFSKPEKFKIYWRQIIASMSSIGLESLGIVALMSAFMGGVIVLQTASNIDSAWLPKYIVGYTTRQSTILEFSPTIISLILAGKIGSSIASEIGTMRVTEQIDALDVMGVNSSGYLILPKIVAAVCMLPFLIIISMALSIGGGMLVVVSTEIITVPDYIYGIQYDFEVFTVAYALIKTVVFAFIITSIPAYFGYYASGGALEVGRSSTRGVVFSSVFILILNYVLTQLMLI